ncbi:hypothetical protein HMI51_12860 [Corallococcus coralloides]|nr:hypothetical protein [Corallococcus coralloides]
MGARKGWQGLLGAGLIMAVGVAEAAPWRSVLYPSTWTPGYSQPGNPSRFLHDFSYEAFTFTTVGKNAASTGYNVALDVIRPVRQ